ncbi:hypothetical protein [Dyadobacter psychrotolerans]|nr:hypothetical protein [Dyadobacter psychrotolerans]
MRGFSFPKALKSDLNTATPFEPESIFLSAEIKRVSTMLTDR